MYTSSAKQGSEQGNNRPDQIDQSRQLYLGGGAGDRKGVVLCIVHTK